MANNTPLSLKLMRLMFKVLTPIIPNVMNRYAYDLWITPTRFKMPDREQLYANKAEKRFITVNDLKIRLWSWGEGPTVLFIHGWGGRGTQISAYIEPLNQAGFKVMSFDLPAHGQSEGKKTNAFDISKTLTEVIKKIDNLHSVVTHSFAGIIFGYCYNKQLALKNVVMLCPPATLNTAFNQFAEMLELPLSVQNYILDNLKHNFGDDVFEKLSLISNCAKIDLPTLVIHDTQDYVVPYQDSINVANSLSHGIFVETNDLGHQKVLYDKAVIARILAFVNTNH